MMRVVHRDPVYLPAGGQQRVPHLVEGERASATFVVHFGMAVIDFEMSQPADGEHVFHRHRPVKIGVIQRRQRPRLGGCP